MPKMNKKTLIYLPIIIAFSITLGMWIGKYFSCNNLNLYLKLKFDSTNINKSNITAYEKLQAVLYYIENDYVDKINKDSLINKAIISLLHQLDPHSIYIPPSDFKEMNEPLEGEFEGIGIEFSIQQDTIVIMNTIIGGPSEKLGLMAGDRIVKVNDSIVAGVGITNTKVLKLLKGPKGTKVKIHIKRNKIKHLLTFTIIRDKIPMHSIDAYMLLNKDLGYIKIARFAKTTPEEFHKALSYLIKQGMKQLIVDVRGNGGGYMDAAITITDEFLKKGELIVYTEGKSQPKREYRATEFGIAENIKLAVLIDEWSASASEIFAGAIQDNDRGYIIGRKSFGKGLVQEPIEFNDGSSIRLTIARYHTPSGRCIQRNYKKTSYEKYYTDLFFRSDSTDSLEIKNAPKFYTSKGRTVYGNGGITPDKIVDINDKNIPEFFYKLINQSIIYQFAFMYSDKNRTFLSSFKSWKELDNYILKSDIYDEFIQYCTKQGIQSTKEEQDKAKDLILNRLRAYIVRNIFNNEGFYTIILERDETFKQASKIFLKN